MQNTAINQFNIYREAPTAEEFVELRKNIGWGETDIKLVQNSLNSSLFHVIIRDKNKLIGMGRIVGDGYMYFYVQDVVVAPDYQNLGLGGLLMSEIESFLVEHAQKGATIGLLAAGGKEGFYRKW